MLPYAAQCAFQAAKKVRRSPPRRKEPKRFPFRCDASRPHPPDPVFFLRLPPALRPTMPPRFRKFWPRLIVLQTAPKEAPSTLGNLPIKERQLIISQFQRNDKA